MATDLLAVSCGRVARLYPACRAQAASSAPTGENWLYEVKLDGYRIQLHKSGLAVTIYSNYAERTIMRTPRQEVAVRRNFLDDFTRHNSGCVELC